jgi:phosphoheptose isomerase
MNDVHARSSSTRASPSSTSSTRRASRSSADGLGAARDGGGRLFILGVGGSAGHAGHAVNDFRKICGFEAYAPTDNVSELTARVNDEGWDTCFSEWLKVSRLREGDACSSSASAAATARRTSA